ncbi:ribonuclease H-like domain-containing protein, partial [Tanacetum coccineum]
MCTVSLILDCIALKTDTMLLILTHDIVEVSIRWALYRIVISDVRDDMGKFWMLVGLDGRGGIGDLEGLIVVVNLNGWCYDDDDGGVGVVVSVAVARVKESECRDRRDPLMGRIFGVGRRTRRKVIPAAGDGGRRWLVAAGKGEFEMSAMGELTFFLGLQVQQRPDGIFISQDKYVQEILKKFYLECVRTATTPYEALKPKSKNEPDSPVNVHLYRSMIDPVNVHLYIDDARDIWNAVKARFGGNAKSKKMRKSMLKQEFSEFRISEAEGLHKGYDRMQKILSQLNQLKAKPEDEDINLKFLRALPSSWSQVALTLKTKGGLELLSFDDLYYKLNTLDVDIKGYSTFSSSQSAGPSHSAFTGSYRSSNVIEDVLQSFVVDTEPEQYEDFDQIEKLDLEEMDLKWQMAMLSVRECRAKVGNDKQRYSSFKIQEIGKKEEDSKALITVDTLVDWTEHDGQSDGVIAPKEFGMIAGCDTEDAIEEGAAKIYNLITRADTNEASTVGDAGEFALMGVTSE